MYEVNGFQVLGLKQHFDQYRDKTLVKVAKDDLTKIEWIDANGRKEALQLEDGVWHYAGMEALDSAAVNQYLESLVNAQGTDFSELTSVNELMISEKLTLFGNNMIAPTSITVYQNNDASKPFVIHSTANPEAIFTSDSTGLYQRVFFDLRQFWPNGQ